MINVGCDIGKGNLDVYIGGRSKRYKNNESGISAFIKRCSLLGRERVVLEPSGAYTTLKGEMPVVAGDMSAKI